MIFHIIFRYRLPECWPDMPALAKSSTPEAPAEVKAATILWTSVAESLLVRNTSFITRLYLSGGRWSDIVAVWLDGSRKVFGTEKIYLEPVSTDQIQSKCLEPGNCEQPFLQAV